MPSHKKGRRHPTLSISQLCGLRTRDESTSLAAEQIHGIEGGEERLKTRSNSLDSCNCFKTSVLEVMAMMIVNWKTFGQS